MNKLTKVFVALPVFIVVALAAYYALELGKEILNIPICEPCPSSSGGIQIACNSCLVNPLGTLYELAQPILSVVLAAGAAIYHFKKVGGKI